MTSIFLKTSCNNRSQLHTNIPRIICDDRTHNSGKITQLKAVQCVPPQVGRMLGGKRLSRSSLDLITLHT